MPSTTREGFEALRAEQRHLATLRFPCCDSKVGLRVSKKGVCHFYHLDRPGTCTYEAESEAHLKLKQQLQLVGTQLAPG